MDEKPSEKNAPRDVIHKTSTLFNIKIDKEMVRFKGHFFLFYGVAGTMTPYLPLIASTRLKLTATSLATILTAQVFITIVSKPLIGYLADYFNKMKLILSTLLLSLTLIYLLLLIIPPIEKPSDSLQYQNSNAKFMKNKTENNTKCITYSLHGDIDVNDSFNSDKNELNVIPLELKIFHSCLINILLIKNLHITTDVLNVSCKSLFEMMHQALNKSSQSKIFVQCFLQDELLNGTKNNHERIEHTQSEKTYFCCSSNNSRFYKLNPMPDAFENDSLPKKINPLSNESSHCAIFLEAIEIASYQILPEVINQVSVLNEKANIKYFLFEEFDANNVFDNVKRNHSIWNQPLLDEITQASNESSCGEIFNLANNSLDVLSCQQLLQVINQALNEFFFMFLSRKKTDRLSRHPAIKDYETYQFWLCAFLLIASGISLSSLYTLSDTICCESAHILGKNFGRQRLYSAIGWSGLASIGGFLCDMTNNYFAAWTLMVLLQCLTLWNLFRMVVVKPNYSKNILKDIRPVLKSTEFLVYNAGVFMNGVWLGAIMFFLIVFLASLGASTFLCGFITVIQCCVGEIPFMFYSDKIINKIGHFNLISLSLLAYGIRFMWYSYLQEPWLVLPVEILHGLTSGIFYPAVATYGKLSASPGTEATTQSILFSTHEGLGAGIGCILTGIGFDQIGGHWTFFYLSLAAFCSTIFNIFIHLIIKKRQKSLEITL